MAAHEIESPMLRVNSNRMTRALVSFMRHTMRECPDLLDSPSAFEDVVSKWLFLNGSTFSKCRPQAIQVFTRPYKGVPTIRIYQKSADDLSVHLLMAVAFADIEAMPEPEPDKALLDFPAQPLLDLPGEIAKIDDLKTFQRDFGEAFCQQYGIESRQLNFLLSLEAAQRIKKMNLF